MTITQNDLLNARVNARQAFSFRRTSIANQVAGTLCSMYRAVSTGQVPTQPAIPAAAALCDKSLTFPFNDPGGALKTYIDLLDGGCTNAGRVLWYDRLFHIGGLNGTLATAQTVNSNTVLTLPARNSAAAEVEWFLECYADLGATTVTANCAVTYTDTTTSTIAVTVPATWRAGRLLPVPPPSGKVIASMQSVTLTATTGTAGNFGVTCGERFAGPSINVQVANVPPPSKQALLVDVADRACLWHVVECSTTSSGDVSGEFTLVQLTP